MGMGGNGNVESHSRTSLPPSALLAGSYERSDTEARSMSTKDGSITQGNVKVPPTPPRERHSEVIVVNHVTGFPPMK